MVLRDSCALHGRTSYADIARDVETKTEAEVKKYSEVFWKRGPKELQGAAYCVYVSLSRCLTRVSDWERIVKVIEQGESRLERHESNKEQLAKKMQRYWALWYAVVISVADACLSVVRRHQKLPMTLSYGPQGRSNPFSEREDLWLVRPLS